MKIKNKQTKAMTREEAIECIRDFMGQLTEGCREAIITAIPELRESEDEKIKKELIAFFTEVRNREGNEGHWHNLKVAAILAYLSSQLPESKDERVRKDIIAFIEFALKGGSAIFSRFTYNKRRGSCLS